MNRWTRWISLGSCASATALAGMFAAPPAHASFSVAVDLYIQDRESYENDVWVDYVPQDEAWVALYAVYSDGSIVPVWPTWNQRPYWTQTCGPQSIRVDVPRGLCLQSIEAYASYNWFDPWAYYEACRPVYVGNPWRHPCEVAVVHAYPVSAWSFSFQWYSGWNDHCDRPVHGCSARRIFAVPGHDYSGWKTKSHGGQRDFYRSRSNQYREIVSYDAARNDDRFERSDERNWDRNDRSRDRDSDRSRGRDDGNWDRGSRDRFVAVDEEVVPRPVERSREVRDLRLRGGRDESRQVQSRERGERRSGQRDAERVERAPKRARTEPRREQVDRGGSREQRRVADDSRDRSSAKRETVRESERHGRDSSSREQKSSGGEKQKSHSDKKSSKDRRVSGEPKGRSRS